MSSHPTPYRNEIESLESRKKVLEHELAAIEERIQARRRLPMLDQVRIATPCAAKWDEMVGDDRKRFCLSCEKNVFNLSALSREEAEQFLLEHASGDVCVRFYQRADGTIMTSDCAVGVKRKRRKKTALAVVGAGALALGAFTSLAQRPRVAMGGMSPMPIAERPTDPGGQWAAGGLEPSEPPAPVTTVRTPLPPPKAPVPPTRAPRR